MRQEIAAAGLAQEENRLYSQADSRQVARWVQVVTNHSRAMALMPGHPEDRLPLFNSEGNGCNQLKGQLGFRRKNDLLLPSCSGNAGSCAASHPAADQCTFSPSRDGPDERTCPGASADHLQAARLMR